MGNTQDFLKGGKRSYLSDVLRKFWSNWGSGVTERLHLGLGQYRKPGFGIIIA